MGDATINGEATTQVSATVDVSQIASAIAKLITSGALKNLMPSGTESTTSTASSTSTAPSAATSESVPTQQQLQQLQSEITSAVQSLTLDVWVAKSSGQLRQVEAKATVVPPAGTAQQETTTSASAGTTTTGSAAQAANEAALQSALQAIKSVSLDATVSIAPATTALKVTPPVNSKPFTDLQAALQSLFSGAFGAGSTSTSAP